MVIALFRPVRIVVITQGLPNLVHYFQLSIRLELPLVFHHKCDSIPVESVAARAVGVMLIGQYV